jgi:hypothetical protein
MSDNGYIVLCSCHKELREELHRIGADYKVVFPDKENHKEVYRRRYIVRGNTPEFIKTQMDNWDNWVGNTLTWQEDGKEIEESSIILCTTPSGIVESMADFLDDYIQYGDGIFDCMVEQASRNNKW